MMYNCIVFSGCVFTNQLLEGKKLDFEQISLNELDLDEGRIFFKIDWFSMVFNDRCFNDVLKWLGIDHFVSDFLDRQYLRSATWMPSLVFSYEGISLETSTYHVYGISEGDESVFDKIVPQLRLDISGSGLDFLRSQGLDVDHYLRDWDQIPQPAHITRCDFAFDLINYKPEILDLMIQHCRENATGSGRIQIFQKQALKFSIREGDQKTLYIGGATSDQMLRVYDKKLQFTDRRTGVYKDNPYNNPDSWIRFELQTRNKKAHKYTYNTEQDAFALFKQIYLDYSFSQHIRRGGVEYKVCEWWQDLFDWDRLSLIVQNLYNGELSVRSYSDRVDAAIARSIGSFLLYLTCKKDVLRDCIRRYLWTLNTYNGNPYNERLRLGLSCKFNNLGIDPNFLREYLYVDHGIWHCKIPWLFGDEVVSMPPESL